MTSPMQELDRSVHARFPGAITEDTSPRDATETRELEIRVSDRLLVVRWRADLGFRLCEVTEDVLFDSADWLAAATAPEALAHVAALLVPSRASATAR
jgi:hypothetical protein